MRVARSGLLQRRPHEGRLGGPHVFLALSADRLRRGAQRLEPLREGGLDVSDRLRGDIAATALEQRLPQTGERAFALGEVGGVPVEALGRLLLSLGLPLELALPGAQLLFLRGRRSLPGLEVGQGRLACGQLLLAPT